MPVLLEGATKKNMKNISQSGSVIAQGTDASVDVDQYCLCPTQTCDDIKN